MNETNYGALVLEYLRTFLDIAIVAYLFYRIYLILAKTRAIQLGLGLLVILAGAMGAQLMQLTTVNFLVETLAQSIVLTIIILLAPELRRLVAQISPARTILFGSKSVFRIDEIVDALKTMAQYKAGAIIVLARQTGLLNYIEKGIRMEATISSELLRTIFFGENPLHDGAVIIDRGVIEAAACYLPLSDSKQLKKTHGARHRAGLGISEESDALVIISSEETGRITICLDGRIIPNIRIAYLKPIITQVMSGQPNYSELLLQDGVPEDLLAKLAGEDWDYIKSKINQEQNRIGIGNG